MITLLIPTMNRSDFLIRLLNYYYELGFDGCLSVGDSSNAEHLARARSAIARYADRLHIVHEEYPGLNNAQCIHLMLERVSTPYCAFVADDDFLVPGGISKCIAFLEQNLDYSAAHGVGIAVWLETSGPFGKPSVTDSYGQAEVEGATAVERLCNYLADSQAVQFSVHRTETWRTMYRDVTTIEDIAFGTEILPCYLSAVLGKIKSLDDLYLVRQLHDQRYIYRSEPVEWITSRAWYPSFEAFYTSVAREVAKCDAIDYDAAVELVQQQYYAKMKSWLIAYYRSREPAKSVSSWRHATRGLLVRALRKIKQSYSGDEPFSLSALLNSSSPYHRDFMQLYKALTVIPAVMRDTDDRAFVPAAARRADEGRFAS